MAPPSERGPATRRVRLRLLSDGPSPVAPRRDWRETLLVAIVFGTALALGLLVSGDYGLGWDEPIQHRLGRQAWRYATGESAGYLRNPDRVYGPAFELLLQAAEKLQRLEDSRDVYTQRHALTFLAFWASVLAFLALGGGGGGRGGHGGS